MIKEFGIFLLKKPAMEVLEQGRNLVSHPNCALACGGAREGKAGGRRC